MKYNPPIGPPERKTPVTEHIKPFYESRTPSPQTIADIFRGSWKSRLPGDIETGAVSMFEDRRIQWFNSTLDGGLRDKSVLELGPFEGYQSYHLYRHGVRKIVSVEANSFNFLKCLCVKELYGLRNVDYLFGDALSFLRECTEDFDVVWASGILYHMQEPVDFLSLACDRCHDLYLWTHYFSPGVLQLNNGQEKHFVPKADRKVKFGTTSITLHARSYNIRNYHENIPAYWEGGLDDLTFWLERDTIIELLHAKGFKNIVVHADADINGLPLISLAASRRP